ncbi:hypothetical protein KDA_21880 [Dictyobacter alpinus]|uniref:Uncharacterized protein n=1 Tax=Dictyobacter alpinus TaxID=2014873 RepID=A0A402B5T3_9CHLR|nr:hypothetical protein [Dictyobacter alpinus]GCE26704.1 hypothetical protein KDA_21880 [Dictyobacter alpinus]
MVRQCAWCLRLIDNDGERLSPLPLPKLYEASHGICGVCGMQWLEQVIESEGSQDTLKGHDDDTSNDTDRPVVERPEPITQMVLQLQGQLPEGKPKPGLRRLNMIRIK